MIVRMGYLWTRATSNHCRMAYEPYIIFEWDKKKNVIINNPKWCFRCYCCSFVFSMICISFPFFLHLHNCAISFVSLFSVSRRNILYVCKWEIKENTGKNRNDLRFLCFAYLSTCLFVFFAFEIFLFRFAFYLIVHFITIIS